MATRHYFDRAGDFNDQCFHVDTSVLVDAAMELRDLLPVAMAEASLPLKKKRGRKTWSGSYILPKKKKRKTSNNFLF